MALKTTIADADWRLVGKTGNPQTAGYTLVREVPFVAATSAASLFATLKATTEYATNTVYVDGTAISLTNQAFANAQVEDAESDKTGRSVTIRQTLKLVSKPADFDAFKVLAYRVLDKEGLDYGYTGATFTPGTVTRDATDRFYVWENIAKSLLATVRGYTRANWAGLAPTGYAFAGLEVAENDDNTLTVKVQYSLEADRAVTNTATVESEYGRTVERVVALDQAAAPTAAMAWTAPGDVGKLKNRSVSLNDKGTYDVATTTDTATADARSLAAYTAEKTKKMTATRQTFVDAATEPTLTETYGSLSKQLNARKLWDGDKMVVTYSGDWLWTDTLVVDGATSVRYKYRQASTGAWYYQTITYTIHIWHCSSITDGWTHINSNPHGALPIADRSAPYGGSHVASMGAGLYEAIHVGSDELTATWTLQTFP